MKLHKPDIKIESQGIRSTTRFSIQATQQSFSVLSSTIYEDKIKAPIRELSTNAYDAHVEAGCSDKPFEVHLPNALDPEFRVRDYGISMSHEKIMTLYTTYFASDKRDTNKLNGCLGLGSKSPFAYTNQFWVTAYENGKKRHYVATVDVDGPRFDEYPSCDTDEENGFEVGFTVKEDDFRTFKETAEEIYQYFKTQPNVCGSTDFQHEEPEQHKVAGNGWKYIGSYGESKAIMGNIAYNIDEDYFVNKDLDYWERRNDKYYKILNTGIHIDFEIGELSMTASREGLEYTDEVIKAVKDKLDFIYQDMQDQVSKEFESCDCLYDARVKAVKYENMFRNLEDLIIPTWKNSKIATHMNLHTDSEVSANDFTLHRFQYIGRPKMSRDLHLVEFSSKHKIFLNDMATGGHAAVKHYLLSNPDDIIYMFQHIDNDNWLTLCGEFGIDESRITKTSQLEKPPRVKREGSTGPRRVDVDAFEFNREGNSYSHTNLYNGRYWSPTSLNIKEGQDNLYVEIHRYEIVDPDGFSGCYPRGISRILNNLEKIGISTKNVYAFPSARANRVKNAKNWVNFYDWAKEKFLDYIQQNDILTIVENDAVSNTMDMSKGIIKVYDASDVPILDGYFKKVADALIKLRDEAAAQGDNVAERVRELSTQLSYKLPSAANSSWSKRGDKLKKRYPVLALYDLECYHYRIEREEATALVKCINDSEVARIAKKLV